jgi:hypothetical protein
MLSNHEFFEMYLQNKAIIRKSFDIINNTQYPARCKEEKEDRWSDLLLRFKEREVFEGYDESRGGFEGEMLKSDNGDLHILSLRDMVGYKLTPDNKISMYKIPSGTNVSDGDNRWKHFDDLAKRGYGDGRPMFLPDTVRKIKKHMATSEIPSKYTDMIDRFDKAVN